MAQDPMERMPSLDNGVMVTPADLAGTQSRVRPWCFLATDLSLRASTSKKSATCAEELQIFSPLSFQPPSPRSAVDCMPPSQSVPPAGSVNEMAACSCPPAMSGRYFFLCSAEPYKPMDFEPANEVMPQIHARPPNE